MAKHKGKKSKIDQSYLLMMLVKANLVAFAVTAIFILLGTMLLTYTNLGLNFEKGFITVGIILSAFFAGYDMAKVETRNGYRWGAVGGASYLLLFLIMSFILSGLKNFDMGAFFLVAILALVTSSAAGMLCVNTRK
jgi:putative membrane protein (TIGR04086 family)